MSLLPRLPLFAAAFTLLSLALALVFLSGQPIPEAQAQTTTPTTTTTVDYDSNDDRLIEISNLAQLNAIRWDLDGDGAVAAADQASYTAAFPNAAAGMGCPDGSDADTNPDPCLGYELKADLTFDTNGDGSITAADSSGLYWNNGAGWTPLGDARNYPFTGQFQGRGKTISHLFINNATAPHLGLFGAIGHRGSVAGVGLTEVSIASSVPTTAGSLVGSSTGRVTTSYATGAIAVNISSASRINAMAGGLVGYNGLAGTVQASFAEVAVSVRHNSASAIVGGLAGQSGGSIQASYAAGAVSGHGNTRFTKVGGLTGNNGGTITASYARGKVTASGSGAAAGGLVGGNLRNGRVVASYWDTTASGQSGSAGGTGQTTNALQTPKGYTGIYAHWNLNLDGVTGSDAPWYFGGAYQYPLLEYGDLKVATQQRDYDADNDQLIEVDNLAQLNAIRWDLNTDGVVAAADQDNYDAAFPGAMAGMGCAQGSTAAACTGYELMSDLDFDTDGDGSTDRFLEPIGRNSIPFTGTFQGNGKPIANLYMYSTTFESETDHRYFCLFGAVGPTGVIDSVKLSDMDINPAVRSSDSALNIYRWIGGLVCSNGGTIKGSSVTGHITVNTGTNAVTRVGGLVSYNYGSITSSYAKVEVESVGKAHEVGGLVGTNSGNITASYSSGTGITADVPHSTGSYRSVAGGLAGYNDGTITASYSRSPVKSTGNNAIVGGLVGWNWRPSLTTSPDKGIITASYSTGPVVATGANVSVGGLVGKAGYSDSNGQEVANSKGTAVDSYWDIGVSGQSSSALGTGMRGTGPTAYTGIYANWNLNLDGVAGNDDPWHFASRQYPILKYGGLDVRNQVHFYIWPATPVVGERARTDWRDVTPWLTRVRGGYVWERSDDGVTGWTVIRSGRQAAIGRNRYDTGSAALFIEPYEANKRFRAWRLSNERGQVYSYITPPATPWRGPTATLTFASGHTAPRVGQAIAISGSDNVRWIRCDDTADNGCDVIVRSATGYTPVAADQGKYLYAYRYYDNSSGVKTMGKTGYIGPVAAAAATP